jgi:hypothetical protein
LRIDKKDEKGVSPFSAHNPHLFVEVIRFSVIRGESMRADHLQIMQWWIGKAEMGRGLKKRAQPASVRLV